MVGVAGLSEQTRQGAAGASDWPQWRGPNRDGLIAAPLPAQWPATLTKRWEIAVGSGHSSPVISGNRVVVHARQGEQEVIRALDLASGKELWRAEYAAPYKVNPAAQAHGPGPKSTPAIGGGRVFTFSIGGVLSALDLATGKVLWQTAAPAVLPQYGTAMSPLVDGNTVIAHAGGHENGAMTAFDAATGKPRWQWKGDGPGYGSPIIATLGGVRQLVAQTQKLLVGLNAADGSLLWQMPFTTAFNQNSITPVISRDLVIITGLDKPLAAIRVARQGEKWTTEQVWSNDKAPMFMSTPVLVGGTLYGLGHRGRGQIVAVDAASGKMLWNTQGREGENASILANPAWLLISTTNGDLIVAKPNSQKYEEVRRSPISDSALWAHPAIARGSIVVKGVDKVVCWGY
jgi:outer membrane protein assembly factor BamB